VPQFSAPSHRRKSRPIFQGTRPDRSVHVHVCECVFSRPFNWVKIPPAAAIKHFLSVYIFGFQDNEKSGNYIKKNKRDVFAQCGVRTGP
jgi:hypothetical protein